MPIGKNSIKRVANNGYANLASSAPDMENSVVTPVEKKAEECAPVEKKAKKCATPVTKKAAAPKKKSAESAKAQDLSEEIERGEYVSFGEDLPTYLL